jgi:hypothetical protein
MRIDIEGEDLIRAAGDPAAKRIIRSAAYFLLAAIGDIPDETEVHTATGAALDAKLGVVPTGTNVNPSSPSIAPAAMAAAANGAGVSGAGTSTTSPVPPPPTVQALASDLPPPPPPPPAPIIGKGDDPNPGDDDTDEDEGTNTGNVPPPPPGVANTAATTGAASSVPTTVPHASSAAAVAGVVSAEVDSAGIPWDERSHQKGKSKKKDNTWKLKKGIDLALVQSVTAELAARRAASPAPTAGSLPLTSTSTGSNTVPVPPVPNGAVASGVPAPNGIGSSVPVPPAPPVGGVGASDATPYRKLIDKITDLTKAGKLTPAKVSEICTSHGSPSLMALKQFEALIPAVDKDIDAAALGLM